MVGACLALVRAVYQVIAPGLDLRQVMRARKAETRAHRGLLWWSRACNTDWAAFIILAPDLASTNKRRADNFTPDKHAPHFHIHHH